MATAQEILLTSETFVKSVLPISDNISGKYIQSAIREAQEMGLKRIVGTALLEKLKDLCAADELDANPAYKELVDESQYYLAYKAGSELCLKVSFKIANMGVVKTTDDNVESVGIEDVDRIAAEYQHKADSCAFELQGWILKHAQSFPELCENDCRTIRANLKSSATCGLWLGGVRGKRR